MGKFFKLQMKYCNIKSTIINLQNISAVDIKHTKYSAMPTYRGESFVITITVLKGDNISLIWNLIEACADLPKKKERVKEAKQIYQTIIDLIEDSSSSEYSYDSDSN